jgi:DNA-binding NarL/FixJ family response regulator
MTPDGLVLSDDLIFFSRIAGAARAAGLTVRQAKTPDTFLTLARAQPPAGVIVDLQSPGLDLAAFLAELKAACPAMPRVTAYGSHVETALLRAAREAGCDRVMPRSQFAKELEGSIAEWLKPATSPAE